MSRFTVAAVVAPIEMDALEAISKAEQEAEAAYGEPAFHALALRYHKLCGTFSDTFGYDPRPMVGALQ